MAKVVPLRPCAGSRLADQDEPPRQVRPVQRYGEQEAQRRDRTVDGRRLHAALGLMDRKATDILGCRRIGRAPEEGREAPDQHDVVALRLFPQAPHGHVVEHAGRSGLTEMEACCWEIDVPREVKVDPSCSEAGATRSSAHSDLQLCFTSQKALPRERVRPWAQCCRQPAIRNDRSRARAKSPATPGMGRQQPLDAGSVLTALFSALLPVVDGTRNTAYLSSG